MATLPQNVLMAFRLQLFYETLYALGDGGTKSNLSIHGNKYHEALVQQGIQHKAISSMMTAYC